jgi:hypothetical protein
MENDHNFNENRNGPDRRKRKVPSLKYIIFGGRRKSIRRKEDKDRLIILDLYSNGIFALAMVILALSALDGLLTLYLTNSGSSELNPFMSYLIDFNPRFYLAVKCIITTAIIIFLIVTRNYKSKLFGIRISKLLTTTALVFFAIIVYQLYIILN